MTTILTGFETASTTFDDGCFALPGGVRSSDGEIAGPGAAGSGNDVFF